MPFEAVCSCLNEIVLPRLLFQIENLAGPLELIGFGGDLISRTVWMIKFLAFALEIKPSPESKIRSRTAAIYGCSHIPNMKLILSQSLYLYELAYLFITLLGIDQIVEACLIWLRVNQERGLGSVSAVIFVPKC